MREWTLDDVRAHLAQKQSPRQASSTQEWTLDDVRAHLNKGQSPPAGAPLDLAKEAVASPSAPREYAPTDLSKEAIQSRFDKGLSGLTDNDVDNYIRNWLASQSPSSFFSAQGTGDPTDTIADLRQKIPAHFDSPEMQQYHKDAEQYALDANALAEYGVTPIAPNMPQLKLDRAQGYGGHADEGTLIFDLAGLGLGSAAARGTAKIAQKAGGALADSLTNRALTKAAINAQNPIAARQVVPGITQSVRQPVNALERQLFSRPVMPETASAVRTLDALANPTETANYARKAIELQREAKASLVQSQKGSLKDKFVKNFFDDKHDIRKLLPEDVMMRRDLVKGTSEAAEMALKQAHKNIYSSVANRETFDGVLQMQRIAELGDVHLVMVGKHIKDKGKFAVDAGQAELKKNIRLSNSELRQALSPDSPLGLREAGKNRYVTADGTVYDATKISHPYGVTADAAKKYIQEEISPDMVQSLNAWSAAMDDILKLNQKHGLISAQEYKSLREAGVLYSPRKVLEYIDPMQGAGKSVSVRSSGLKNLEEGTLKALELDSELLLRELYTRTYSRIFKNDANRALHRYALSPDNTFIRTVSKNQPAKPNEGVISLFEDGRRIELAMPKQYAEAWEGADPLIQGTFKEVLGWFSGSKILKPMATGLNPEFALTNLPRDIAHAWLTSGQYSSHLPVFVGQMARDVASVAKDAALRKGLYEEYIKAGGGMALLSRQGRFNIPGLNKLQEYLGYVGETSELLTRLATMKRAIRNGESVEKAVWTARTTIDFAQGGAYAKAIDSFIPYFNAGLQGIRTGVAAAKKNPQEFATKMAWLASVGVGIDQAGRILNPEAHAALSKNERINKFNFIFPKEWGYYDANGEFRHRTIAIEKDQNIRPFMSLFSNLMAASLGQSYDVDEAVDAAKDLVGMVKVFTAIPSVAAAYHYLTNRDVWMDEKIWRGTRGDIDPREEYTRQTNPVYIKAGELTGWSPERLANSVAQFFTRGNIYTYAMGGATQALLGDMPPDDREVTMGELLTKLPFTRKIFRSTSPYQEYKEEAYDAEIQANTHNWKQNRELNNIMRDMEKGRATQKDVQAFINKQSPLDRQRLWTSYATRKREERVEDNSLKRLKGLPAGAQANILRARLEKAQTREEKNKIMRDAALLGMATRNIMARVHRPDLAENMVLDDDD
ncbi:MAG: hypothetical protein FWG92_02380 [Leptospirales bacterium]|nr:hypothetical protein [Leptospirales bacterium]